ncbi:MAG: hypothetical protein F4138_07405 [Acidimicrobiia bacterium]|nr:hypothetical protein [Acidimicrobiia bacterium]
MRRSVCSACIQGEKVRSNKLFITIFGLLAVLALVTTACGNDDNSDSTVSASTFEGSRATATAALQSAQAKAIAGSVIISGSSTVEPISVRVAELFEPVQPDIEVTVDGPGTGDGFKLFCTDETDISNASRQITDSEAKDCAVNEIEFVELRVGIDGIAVMTGENNPVECVSFNDIYGLVGPESTGFRSWTDAGSLTGLNTSSLPNANLDIFGPGEESGTFDSFVEIVLEDIADKRRQDATTRPDYNANADDNVIIQGIQSSDSSFGWVGFAFAAHASGVKLLEVDGGDGCVGANADTIASGEYPVSRSLYIYVNKAKAADNPAVAAYVDFYMSDEGLGTAVSDVGYVNLIDDAKNDTRDNWAAR